MRRLFLGVACVAMAAAVTSCGGGKSMVAGATSARQEDDMDRQIALKKKQMELDNIDAEAKRQKLLNEQKDADMVADIEQKKQQTRKMAAGEQRTIVFCMDEAFDRPGEYMGGLGVVEGRPDRTHAILDANRAAIADIATRYIGMIKNAIEDYSKDVSVPSGKKMYESTMEGGAASIGTKVIDKYANAVCREVSQAETGGWVGYVAVHVMLQDAQRGLADELEVRKVDYDKKKFFEKMDAELEKASAKRKAELEAME